MAFDDQAIEVMQPHSATFSWLQLNHKLAQFKERLHVFAGEWKGCKRIFGGRKYYCKHLWKIKCVTICPLATRNYIPLIPLTCKLCTPSPKTLQKFHLNMVWGSRSRSFPSKLNRSGCKWGYLCVILQM